MSTDTYETIRKRARAVILAGHVKLADLAAQLRPEQKEPDRSNRTSEWLRGVHEPKADVILALKAFADEHWDAAKGKRKSELNRAMQAQGD